MRDSVQRQLLTSSVRATAEEQHIKDVRPSWPKGLLDALDAETPGKQFTKTAGVTVVMGGTGSGKTGFMTRCRLNRKYLIDEPLENRQGWRFIGGGALSILRYLRTSEEQKKELAYLEALAPHLDKVLPATQGPWPADAFLALVAEGSDEGDADPSWTGSGRDAGSDTSDDDQQSDDAADWSSNADDDEDNEKDEEKASPLTAARLAIVALGSPPQHLLAYCLALADSGELCSVGLDARNAAGIGIVLAGMGYKDASKHMFLIAAKILEDNAYWEFPEVVTDAGFDSATGLLSLAGGAAAAGGYSRSLQDWVRALNNRAALAGVDIVIALNILSSRDEDLIMLANLVGAQASAIIVLKNGRIDPTSGRLAVQLTLAARPGMRGANAFNKRVEI